ncbi:MAG TPA: carboxypeptidase-like regulatory domain-containing protein [Burkholderiaceae bacterium]
MTLRKIGIEMNPTMMNKRSLAGLCAGTLLLAVGATTWAQAGREIPLKGADIFVDQQDNLATRVKVQADGKGRFSVANLKPGMYRVVVQTTDLAPGEKQDAQAKNVGQDGLRNAARWGEARRSYGNMKYVTVYIEPTASSGPFSMNQKLVNGRTAGVLFNITQNGEVLRGRAMGSSQ